MQVKTLVLLVYNLCSCFHRHNNGYSIWCSRSSYLDFVCCVHTNNFIVYKETEKKEKRGVRYVCNHLCYSPRLPIIPIIIFVIHSEFNTDGTQQLK